MRKWFLYMLFFMISLVLSGCNIFENSEDNIPKANEIIISSAKNEILVGEELELTVTVNPVNSSQLVTWSVSNSEILSITENGKIKGLKVGTSDVIAISKENSKIQGSITITVKENQSLPTGIELTSSTATIQKGSSINLLANVLPIGTSQEVIYSSSDEEIATIDVNGKLNAINSGTVTITAKVKANQSLSATLELQIIDPNITEIQIAGESVVIEGDSLSLTTSVLPVESNQGVIWSSSNEEYATVNSSGVVIGLKEGIVLITATSIANPDIYSIKEISVIPHIHQPVYPDLEGYQIKIMVASHVFYEYDPNLEDYSLIDKDEKLKAWQEIEEAFNVDFEVVAYPEIARWGDDRVNWLIDKANSNQSEADFVVSSTDWIKDIVDSNALIDTKLYYQIYGGNKMPRAYKDANTYNSGLYGFPTNTYYGVNIDNGIIYNVAMVKRLQLESPAKLFNEGRWNYTGFSNYVKQAFSKLDEGQSVLSGKAGLFYLGMINSGGTKIKNSDNTYNFNTQCAADAASVLRDLYITTGFGTNAWGSGSYSFHNGDSLFVTGEYWSLNTCCSYPDWGNPPFEDGYGFVPYPYPDNLSKEDVKTVYRGGIAYVMPTGRVYPDGINSEKIYWAFTEMMNRTNLYLSETTNLSDLLDQSIRTKVREDEESVEAIKFFDQYKLIYDDFYNLSQELRLTADAIDTIVFSGADYNQTIIALENNLNNLYS